MKDENTLKQNRCKYLDPITGFQCKNFAQKDHQYCRRCQIKIKQRSRKVQRVVEPKPIMLSMFSSENKNLLPFALQQECLRFLSDLSKKVTFSKVILYGSFTQNCAHNWSDVDLAVVSSRFVGMPFIQRTILLRRVGLDSGALNIQAIGLTPHDFEHGERPLILQRIRKGIVLLKEKEN